MAAGGRKLSDDAPAAPDPTKQGAVMSADTELQRDVLEELDWDPTVDASEVGVTVEEGVVTLSGTVRSYAEKYAVERAVKRIEGVRDLVYDLQVHVAGPLAPDDEVARRAIETLRWNTAIPHERVRVAVQDGRVTLRGSVPWNFQRRWAERLVLSLAGVRGVSNEIRVEPEAGADPVAIRARIGTAFHRSAELDARRIEVEAQGGKVILRGRVSSWAERQEAERAAWAAPGVHEVVNELVVRRREELEAGPPGA